MKIIDYLENKENYYTDQYNTFLKNGDLDRASDNKKYAAVVRMLKNHCEIKEDKYINSIEQLLITFACRRKGGILDCSDQQSYDSVIDAMNLLNINDGKYIEQKIT